MKSLSIIIACTLVACATTTTTAPDGSVIVTKAADPAAIVIASKALDVYAARKVREEKSGRITRAEIARRWKP